MVVVAGIARHIHRGGDADIGELLVASRNPPPNAAPTRGEERTVSFKAR